MSNNRLNLAFNWHGEDLDGRNFLSRLSLLGGEDSQVKLRTVSKDNYRSSIIRQAVEPSKLEKWSNQLEQDLEKNPEVENVSPEYENEGEKEILIELYPGSKIEEQYRIRNSEGMIPKNSRDILGFHEENVPIWTPPEIEGLTDGQNWSNYSMKEKMIISTLSETYSEEITEMLEDDYTVQDITEEDLGLMSTSNNSEVDSYRDSPFGLISNVEDIAAIPGPAIAKRSDIDYLRGGIR